MSEVAVSSIQRTVRRVRIAVITFILLVLGIFVWAFLFGFSDYFASTPEEWLEKESGKHNGVSAIVAVDYGNEVLGFQSIASHRRGTKMNGVQVSTIRKYTDFGMMKSYKLADKNKELIYEDVDVSNYEERYRELPNRTIVYGIANDIGKSQILVDTCNIVELNVKEKTYWFFYERL